MANYRVASGATVGPQLFLRRWTLLPLFVLALLLTVWLIAGSLAGEVFFTLLQGIFVVPVLVPAAMLGIVLTAPLEKRAAFADSPWPPALRLLLGTALALGAMSLAMLGLGSCGLLIYGIPLGIPVLAALMSYLPTRDFLKSCDGAPLQRAATPSDYLVLLAAIPAALMLIAATYPPGSLWLSEGLGYDVLEYHLQCPREYLANNSTAPLRHNVYSFLPANVEMLYLQLMWLVRLVEATQSYVYAVYPAQVLHSVLMLLTAGVIALAPVALSSAARWIAALAFLGTGWVLVTGSLAYNEGGLLLFGTLALALCFARPSRAVSITIGALLGLAIGCKLTAGTMLVIPVALLLLMRGQGRQLLWVILLAACVYAPWALRAAAATGNPVFPLATRVLGSGHWSAAQAARWDAGHRPAPPAGQQDGVAFRLGELARQTVGDPQFSLSPLSAGATALGAARPPAWLGVGWLWLAAVLGVVLAVWRGPQAWMLGGVLLVQIVCWLTLTHLQARFLLPALVPLVWLIGLGATSLRAGQIVLGVLIALHAASTLVLLKPETELLFGPPANPHRVRWQPIGHLPSYPDAILAAAGRERRLPENVGTYLLGDARALWYHGRVIYATAFDQQRLLTILRRDGKDAARRYLAEQRINYLMVNWAEIQRLARTYGFAEQYGPTDARQYVERLRAEVQPLLDGFPRLWSVRGLELYLVEPPVTKELRPGAGIVVPGE